MSQFIDIFVQMICQIHQNFDNITLAFVNKNHFKRVNTEFTLRLTLYNVILRITRNFLETRENTKIESHPFYHIICDWFSWGSSKKKRVWIFFVIQKENRQPCLFSFRLQIESRKNMIQALKKNRVDATLYFLKFQNLKNFRSTWYLWYQCADWLGECVFKIFEA